VNRIARFGGSVFLGTRTPTGKLVVRGIGSVAAASLAPSGVPFDSETGPALPWGRPSPPPDRGVRRPRRLSRPRRPLAEIRYILPGRMVPAASRSHSRSAAAQHLRSTGRPCLRMSWPEQRRHRRPGRQLMPQATCPKTVAMVRQATAVRRVP